jgi:hypothetical protein
MRSRFAQDDNSGKIIHPVTAGESFKSSGLVLKDAQCKLPVIPMYRVFDRFDMM